MKQHNQSELLRERRFLPFFVTQFLGAFNDNVFKNALAIIVTYNIFQLALNEGDTNKLINLVHALFILPFFLFSATSGQIADKYEKSFLIRRIKLLECAIMVVAALGFYWQNLYLLLIVLFMMGAQSTLFGPIKYALLPQVLDDSELVGGNGLVEMGTFVAILLGTLAGGMLINLESGSLIIAVSVIGLAILGYFTSLGIPKAAAPAPSIRINWNFFSATANLLRIARKERVVFLSVLGISWFWFFGSVIIAQIPNFNKIILNNEAELFAILLASFSIGIAAGSMLCERLSGHRVEIGLVPFGSFGLTVFTVDLYFASQYLPPLGAAYNLETFFQHSEHYRVLIDMLLIGVFGGFYIVPLYALIQQRSAPEARSRVIAANNVINSLFMVVAAGMSAVLLASGVTIPELFLITGLLNVAVALYIYGLVPEFLMRFLVWILISTIYRIRHENLDRIPDEGGAVIVCNHVSFVDAMVIAGCCRRPIRFVMDHQIFKVPVLSFVFRTAKAIPIASAKANPKIKANAMDEVAKALENGEIVGIFPEGQITYDGELAPFKPGIEEIIRRTPVPVIPMALQGFWGSFFSRKRGRAMASLPRRFWSKVGISVGAPIPPEQVTANGLQAQVAELRGDDR